MGMRIRMAASSSASAAGDPGSATGDPGSATRRGRRRLTRFLVATALLSSGLVLGPTSPASASGCALGVVCGKVENKSDFGLYTTVALNKAGSPDRCAVWNTKGGTNRSQETWVCTQRYLAPGSTRGGNFTGEDVDAFTFNDRPYYVVIGGESLLVQQGIWTKISDTETATCKPYVSSAARCIVWASL